MRVTNTTTHACTHFPCNQWFDAVHHHGRLALSLYPVDHAVDHPLVQMQPYKVVVVGVYWCIWVYCCMWVCWCGCGCVGVGVGVLVHVRISVVFICVCMFPCVFIPYPHPHPHPHPHPIHPHALLNLSSPCTHLHTHQVAITTNDSNLPAHTRVEVVLHGTQGSSGPLLLHTNNTLAFQTNQVPCAFCLCVCMCLYVYVCICVCVYAYACEEEKEYVPVLYIFLL